MIKQRSAAIRLAAGTVLMAAAAGGALSAGWAASATAPHIAPVPPVPVIPPVPPVPIAEVAPPAPPVPPVPPVPPGEGVVLRHGQLSAAERAEIRAAAEEARAAAREAAAAHREALLAAGEARREAEAARREAMAAARRQMAATCAARGVKMPTGADPAAFAACGHARRGELRAALVSARTSVAGARGMREADRKAALDSIDKALSGLDWNGGRGPALQ